MAKTRAIIYGAGGHARELAFQLQASGARVLAFVDDFDPGRSLDQTPVVSYEQAITMAPDANWFIAIGSLDGRMKLIERLDAAGATIGTFVSPNALVSPTAVVGEGCQIFANAVISADVVLGDHGIVNFGAVLHHDVKVGTFCFIAANATVAGHVEIGSRVWLGAGCVIRNGVRGKPIKIGDGSIIGAGACVVSDIGPDLIAIGVPAKSRTSLDD